MENLMKFFYYLLFLLFASNSSYALEYSCIDKKHGYLSKMTIDGESIKYEDQKGEPLDYKIVENSEIALMAISNVSAEENPILNYIFIIKDKSLAFNTILRSINDNYNEIFTKNKILKCIGNNDQKKLN
tara:strand:- start:85 stop:471 length:387 start_codon:yes stop_codon:yes gene_type:complete